MKKQKKRKQSLRVLEKEKPEEFKLGYISKKGSVWYFFEINAEEDTYPIYEVVGNTSNSKFQQELPVKCFIKEKGKVVVVDVYTQHELPEKMEKPTKPKEKKEKKHYLYFGEAKVLIVGSRNLADYQQRLIKHGLEVDTHNPFEESYTRLEGKCKRADIVLVCTSHISHSVMDHIDKKQEKVLLVERDNEDWLSTLVHFTMKQFNLLPEAN